jgi:hypothetical protein
MGVDLGCRNAFVTEHFLDGAQVCAAFDEVGGEGMAESVGRDTLCYSGLADKVFQEQEDHYAGELTAAAIEEDDVFAAWFWRDVYPDILQVNADILYCRLPNGD